MSTSNNTSSAWHRVIPQLLAKGDAEGLRAWAMNGVDAGDVTRVLCLVAGSNKPEMLRTLLASGFGTEEQRLRATVSTMVRQGSLMSRENYQLMLGSIKADEHAPALYAAAASIPADWGVTDLVNAVRVVATGNALFSPTVTRRLVADFTRHHPRGPVHRDLAGLTAREREVLTLLARGLCNGEIAEALTIVEQTAKTHVSRVLTKLGLRDRAQAVVIAYESGLVVPGE